MHRSKDDSTRLGRLRISWTQLDSHIAQSFLFCPGRVFDEESAVYSHWQCFSSSPCSIVYCRTSTSSLFHKKFSLCTFRIRVVSFGYSMAITFVFFFFILLIRACKTIRVHLLHPFDVQFLRLRRWNATETLLSHSEIGSPNRFQFLVGFSTLRLFYFNNPPRSGIDQDRSINLNAFSIQALLLRDLKEMLRNLAIIARWSKRIPWSRFEDARLYEKHMQTRQGSLWNENFTWDTTTFSRYLRLCECECQRRARSSEISEFLKRITWV